MYLSLLLQILEKRPAKGKFSLASESKSKLSFSFLPKQKVLAPITAGSNLAAWRAGAALSRLLLSDPFRTLCLSEYLPLQVSSASFVQGSERRSPAPGRAPERDRGELPPSSCRWVSQWLSHSSGPLYIISSEMPGALAVAEQDSGLVSVQEFLYRVLPEFQQPVHPCWPNEGFFESQNHLVWRDL